MALPSIDLIINNTIKRLPEDGSLVYKYSPLYNLKGEGVLEALELPAKVAGIDINTPLDLDLSPSFDNSVNILVNDKKNPLKLINSRFYLDSSKSYRIADRKGSLDTNIYSADEFKSETGFIKPVKTIASLEFLGLAPGGILKVGNYNFYFKLADSDGNESDFVAESGIVTCHIGTINDPKSIRGGQSNENSEKAVRFKLSNLDPSYSYVYVYFSRKSGSPQSSFVEVVRIHNKFRLDVGDTYITITGFETQEILDESVLNMRYAEFDAVKSGENCQNITFVGNTEKDYELFNTLQKYSLFITPKLSSEQDVGNLDVDYKDITTSINKWEYYNAKNIYYRVGYWDEEMYRFGIVYILNDYTLSPVFNIRGIKELKRDTAFKTLDITKPIEYGEDYFILNNSVDSENPENIKGVFKINDTQPETFDAENPIKPIGIGFSFQEELFSGESSIDKLTKGFFFVRQNRIPSIITQAISIPTSNKTHTPLLYGSVTSNSGQRTTNYFSESFLNKSIQGFPKLGRATFEIGESLIKWNALLCPEASVQNIDFASIFNGSEFILRDSKYKPIGGFGDLDSKYSLQRLLFMLGKFFKHSDSITSEPAKLLLIPPGVSKLSNDGNQFSSKVGDAQTAWEVGDAVLGDIEDDTSSASNDSLWTNSVSKIRGIFNTYIGTNITLKNSHRVYNILQKGYNFANWKEYFRIRSTNQSTYFPIGDRYPWAAIKENNYSSTIMYRGDCYINTYAHRMLWNFIDPDLPTTTKIIDTMSWFRNYRVKTTSLKKVGENVHDITQIGGSGSDVNYKKALELFTYDSDDLENAKVILVDGPKFEKSSEEYGLYGVSKINRPDINAINLGHWACFKICGNINLAMRDIDFSQSSEESLHNKKRSFYPLEDVIAKNRLPEALIINKGIASSQPSKHYFELPDVPFIKTVHNTRIYHSNVLQEAAFMNGNRIFQSQNYQDYPNDYGSLVKLVEWQGQLIAIMEHGVLKIPVNERALMANASGESVYINTDNILPKNPEVLSPNFGSLWPESIIKTERFIYGIDTVGKKIWRTNGGKVETFSDLKIQRFLNDNIKIAKSDSISINSIQFVKSHYNAFKSDILFTFKFGTTYWNLCWNELLEKWTTRYTWFPEFSENINNIFYTFACKSLHENKGKYLYKHGFAGDLEEGVNILPTKWYDQQYPFEFEFVVSGEAGVQKIFNNLKIFSNNTPPDSIYYEVIGDSFEWSNEKSDIHRFTTDQEFENYLKTNLAIKKIPYIKNQQDFIKDRIDDPALKDITLKQDKKLREVYIQTYQKGSDIKKQGRLKGNMEYVEDSWDVQVQPISFKYAYLKNGLLVLSDTKEMKLRDKFIKIRIRYSGDKYAIINSILTMFTISYA